MSDPGELAAAPPPRIEARRVKIWDAPVRLVHWALVALIAFSWWSVKAHHMEWHLLSGYAVLGLVIFRVIWGFVGSDTARFAGFVRGPTATLAYLRTLPDRRAPAPPGHNPLGAWSVLALLGLIAGVVGLGLFSVDTDGLESGPLADRVSFDFGRACAKLHDKGFDILLWLIGLHVAAVAFYLVYKRRDLIGPMIGGSGRADADADGPALRFAPVWRLIVAAAVAVGLAWFVSKGLRLH